MDQSQLWLLGTLSFILRGGLVVMLLPIVVLPTQVEVRLMLGGNLGSSGCVAYLFEKRGVASFDPGAIDVDALMEAALDAGANDVVESGSSIEVVTTPQSLAGVVQTLSAKGFTPTESNITMEASTTVSLAGSDAESMLRVTDALEDLDDVQNVYANFDISDAEMQRIAG